MRAQWPYRGPWPGRVAARAGRVAATVPLTPAHSPPAARACRASCARLLRALRTPAPRASRQLTPARPLAPAPSAPTRPARSLAQPTARPTPYRGRPAGRIAGPSAVSQRAPGRIVGGDARQACAQPAQLHNTPKSQHKECVTTHLGSSPVLLFLHQNFFFSSLFMINIYIFFINSSSMKNH